MLQSSVNHSCSNLWNPLMSLAVHVIFQGSVIRETRLFSSLVGVYFAFCFWFFHFLLYHPSHSLGFVSGTLSELKSWSVCLCGVRLSTLPLSQDILILSVLTTKPSPMFLHSVSIYFPKGRGLQKHILVYHVCFTYMKTMLGF